MIPPATRSGWHTTIIPWCSLRPDWRDLCRLFRLPHGLAGIYGLAFDAVTSGGPYLWAFARITPDGLHRIVRIPVASGIPDGVSFPVMHRLGDQLAYGQAGGLSIANGLAPGRLSLVGVLQGVPDDLLFSVELSSDSLLAADAAMDTFGSRHPIRVCRWRWRRLMNWNGI